MTTTFHLRKVWAEAQRDLRGLIYDEKQRTGVGVKGTDRLAIFRNLTETYLRYLEVYRKLNLVYDQQVHPQKGELLRALLDMSITRLIEIRQALVVCECSEVLYFDHVEFTHRWTPDKMEMEVPYYYTYDRDPIIKEKEKWLDDVLRVRRAKQAADDISAAEAKTLEEKQKMTMKDDVSLLSLVEEYPIDEVIPKIQIMERWRQGIVEYKIFKEEHFLDQRYHAHQKWIEKRNLDRDKAATLIQSLVRAFLARSRVANMRQLEAEFLGIHTSFPRASTKNRMEIMGDKAERNKQILEQLDFAMEQRRIQRRINAQQLETQRKATEVRLRVVEGLELVAENKMQIRNWMLHMKEQTGKLPDIPKAHYGGSQYLFCPDKLPRDALEKGLMGEHPDLAKSAKKGKKAEAVKKSGAKKKAGDSLELKLEAPSYLEDLVKSNVEYNTVWRRRDERHNVTQSAESILIIPEQRAKIAKEVRDEVDALLRAELNLLRQALEKKKGKKGKKGKGKKGKSKGKKGKKGKKKKKGKDLTPDRTTQSLFEELVEQNIIQKVQPIPYNSLSGAPNMVNGSIRAFHSKFHGEAVKTEENGKPISIPGDANPIPNYGDVKRAVKDICIMPMGSISVHKLAPFTKSLLIAGPSGVGKSTLVHSVCHELGATLIDLTAVNIAGKYPGKPGLNMLIHLVNKVGRLVQPTIVVIDSVEKTYMKRVAKTDKTEPKRLKKQLGKLIKSIGPDDRMMVIGLSSEPWIAPLKLLKKDFQRILFIPKLDADTRRMTWVKALTPWLEYLHNDINLTLLAKLSEGWNYSAINGLVSNVTKRYVDEAQGPHDWQKKTRAKGVFDKPENENTRPLTIRRRARMDDFVKELSLWDPVFLEQDKAWNSWFNKTSLQKARLSLVGGGEEEVKKKAKGKKGKGKKK